MSSWHVHETLVAEQNELPVQGPGISVLGLEGGYPSIWKTMQTD